MADLSPEGRVALVTGGESDIGKGCVAALAAAGADVGVIYFHDRDAGEASAAVAAGTGRRSVALQANVADESDVEAAFDKLAGQNMSGTPVPR